MARARRKSPKVLIRCAAPGCTRRVRRKPHSGPRYCGLPSCKQRAFRARRAAERRLAEEARAKAERSRLNALESAKTKALALRSLRSVKTMMRYAFTPQEKEVVRDIDRREVAAIRSVASIEGLDRIKREHEEERSPLIEEASKRPPRGPSDSALRAAAIMEAEKRAQRAARREQRRRKPKLRKSPLEIGTVSVSGGEERRGRGPTVVVRRG